MLPGRHTEVRLTRTELEAMVRPALDETIAATTRGLRTAGLQASDLRAFVLVGGSSRIPLVAQLVTSALGRPVAVDTDPKHAIALGAARHAHLTATGPGAITSPSRQTAPGLAAAAAVSPFATPPPPTRSGPDPHAATDTATDLVDHPPAVDDSASDDDASSVRAASDGPECHRRRRKPALRKEEAHRSRRRRRDRRNRTDRWRDRGVRPRRRVRLGLGHDSRD